LKNLIFEMIPLSRNQAGILLAAVLVFCSPLHGAVITLNPVADTMLMQAATGNNAGGTTWMNAGTANNGLNNRALVRFDPAGTLPANAQITFASLTLEVTRQPAANPVDSTFAISRVLQSWGEGNKVSSGSSPGLGQVATSGEATWNDRFALTSQPWSSPGGTFGPDFSTTISSEVMVLGTGDSPYTIPSTGQMIADVQSWYDQPANNHGWVIFSESEGTRGTARSFGSRESGFAPALNLSYTIVPEPSILMIGISGWLALLWSYRNQYRKN
jgi:hypothetical protein